MVLSVDLKEGDIKEGAQVLGIMHRKSILKGELEEFYEKVKTLSPRSIVQALVHESTLKVIRALMQPKQSKNQRFNKHRVREGRMGLSSK